MRQQSTLWWPTSSASGPLTDLINNAAGNFISRTQDLSPRGFDAIANIVMHGTFYVTHAVGKRWITGSHRAQAKSPAECLGFLSFCCGCHETRYLKTVTLCIRPRHTVTRYACGP